MNCLNIHALLRLILLKFEQLVLKSEDSLFRFGIFVSFLEMMILK